MNNLLKIVLSIIGLSLFYLWMSFLFQSCGNKNQEKGDDLALVDELSDDEEIIDVSDEDFFEDGTEGIVNDATDESFEELENSLIEEPTKQKSQPASNTNTRTTSNNSGSYMLVSGNYLVEGNANEMVNKLKNLGYTNAEVVIFDRSQYHTVVASRFSSYETALQSASMLKQKGVDCYVKKRS